jgi:DNA-binding response OmpR family regulator
MAPPRVLVVMPDQWRRALLRGALREAGYDAVGARGVREARIIQPEVPDRGPVRLFVVDQDALASAERNQLVALRTRHHDPDIILLARATIRPPEGPWKRVLRRPVSVAELVTAVEALLPLPPELHHAIDAL